MRYKLALCMNRFVGMELVKNPTSGAYGIFLPLRENGIYCNKQGYYMCNFTVVPIQFNKKNKSHLVVPMLSKEVYTELMEHRLRKRVRNVGALYPMGKEEPPKREVTKYSIKDIEDLFN